MKHHGNLYRRHLSTPIWASRPLTVDFEKSENFRNMTYTYSECPIFQISHSPTQQAGKLPEAQFFLGDVCIPAKLKIARISAFATRKLVFLTTILLLLPRP